MNDNEARKDKSEFDQALEEVKIFAAADLVFGLPRQIFIAGIVLSIGLMMAMPIVVGLVFCAVYYFAMYSIHASDVRALDAWRRMLTSRFSYWSGGRLKRKRLQVLRN